MAEKDNNNEKFVKGAAVLAAAGLIVKVLGTFLRIPLGNWISAEGMANYSVAYSIYSALLVVSTAGIPVAISRLVSAHLVKREYKYAQKVFHVALMLMTVIGILGFLVSFFGADLIASLLKNTDAAPAIRAIAPALLLVPLFSSFRGYFNGRQNMNPTAISEVMEQVVRICVGLALAYWLLQKAGEKEAAAGATFGASAGALAGLIVITGIYMLNRKVIHRKIENGLQNTERTSVIAKQIIFIAIPIIIGSSIMPIMNLIDTGMTMRVLQSVGWSVEESKYLYGLLSALCASLIAFPQFMTQAVAISLVPAVSRRHAVGDTEGLVETMKLGFRTTTIMAFPCMIGMMVLAEPILKLLYFRRFDECVDAAPILMFMSVSIIALSMEQTTTSVLQGMGKQMYPVRNLAIGCLFKIVVTFTLLRIHAINVSGAAIGTIVADFVAFYLNSRKIEQFTGGKADFVLTYVRPFIASAIMGAVAWGVHFGLAALLADKNPVVANMVSTIVAIMIAVVVYVILIFAVKAITFEELDSLPGGAKLKRILGRFRRNAE